jgi:hypothetical protein
MLPAGTRCPASAAASKAPDPPARNPAWHNHPRSSNTKPANTTRTADFTRLLAILGRGLQCLLRRVRTLLDAHGNRTPDRARCDLLARNQRINVLRPGGQHSCRAPMILPASGRRSLTSKMPPSRAAFPNRRSGGTSRGHGSPLRSPAR